MRFSGIFILGFLFLSILGAGSFFVYKINYGNTALEYQIESHLISVAEGKSKVLSFYLDERKFDLEFLAGSKEVTESLSGGKVSPISKEVFNKFKELNGYPDLILIDVDGKILFGGDDLLIVQSDVELNTVYEKVQNDFGVGVFDPGYFEGKELSIFITTPVLVDMSADKKKNIGYLFLKIENSEIESRISKDVGFGKIGSTYVVNRDGGLVTQPVNGEIYSNKISSKMFEDCFQDYRNFYFKRGGQRIDDVEKSGVYDNYLGEKVYGAHQYILENSWCVLAEVNKAEFEKIIFNEEKKSINKMVYGFLVMLLLLFAFILILQKDIKIGGERNK